MWAAITIRRKSLSRDCAFWRRHLAMILRSRGDEVGYDLGIRRVRDQ